MKRAIALLVLGLAGAARAFCGFYVAGGGADLFNNATQVVLLRDGTRTVLSMQNNYQGPPEAFAMVIPVPVVLQKDQVKTLKKEVFEHLDRLTAPRLVEYREVDPCAPMISDKMAVLGTMGGGGAVERRRVTIEAQFAVGEYEIVILSAKDALGLESWLKENKYRIPEGAAPLFRPYIERGMKFFVAKVDPKKVTFKDGAAALSPLRFFYDTEKFELPIRLGLINAKDTQDLIIHILARNQRYDVANYPNATIPTNIDLVPSAKSEFAAFYVSLFDQTLKKHPGAVITEYAWQASSCDPCPTAPLSENDMATLGADVVGPRRGGSNSPWDPSQQWVVTRLHARYTRETAAEDLVFRAAKPIEGGREFDADASKPGALSQGVREAGLNNFQGRYAIRYPWKGAVACEGPQWDRWGDPGSPASAQNVTTTTRKAGLVESLSEAGIDALGVQGLKPQSGLALRPHGVDAGR